MRERKRETEGKSLLSIQREETRIVRLPTPVAAKGREIKRERELYKTYVRPLFEYGSISLIHRPSEIKRLQQIQNKFIRTSLKIPSYIRTDLIHDAAGLETVQTRLEDLNKKLLSKIEEQEQIRDLIQYRNSIVPMYNYKSPLDMFGTISS